MKLVQFAGAVIASALFTGAQAQQPASQSIVVKFSHVVADETPKGKGAIRFKELAEAKTKGRVKVEVYPNSQLYKDREELEALQLGAVQMLAPSVSKFGPLGVRKFEVFDLPYMFDDERSLYNPRLKRRYAITEDDIPNMLIDEAETVDDAEQCDVRLECAR